MYDGNESVWDPILELLNLALCYQPAIAIVLHEERWRTAANPKAYVATAAYRRALSMNLLDFADREFRGGGTRNVDNDRSQVCLQRPDDAAQLSHEEKVEYGVYQSAPREAWDSMYQQRIPEWLRDPVEYEEIDWNKVAVYAALKPSMVRLLAFVLSLRFAKHLTREQAIRRGRASGHGNKVAATWKWIDRNLRSRIAPLFKMESPPKIATSTKAKSSHLSKISAGEAIRQACARERRSSDLIGSPSIKQDQHDLRRYTILQPGTLIWKRDEYGIIDGTPYRTDLR